VQAAGGERIGGKRTREEKGKIAHSPMIKIPTGSFSQAAEKQGRRNEDVKEEEGEGANCV